MQTRTVVGLGGLVGVAVLGITQLGQQSSDRQYKKTLAYMHDGREKFAAKMNQAGTAVSDTVSGKK
jgi:hypothetical protein